MYLGSTSTGLVRISGGDDGEAKTDVVARIARTMATSIVDNCRVIMSKRADFIRFPGTLAMRP